MAVNIAEDDPFPDITSCAELQAMKDDLSRDYSLAHDIDCAGFDPNHDGKGFIPVGDNITPFTGSLNGNNHTITNLTIMRPEESGVGLFGYVDGTTGRTFQNLTITGSIEGLSAVGSFVGYMMGNITIDSVSSSVTVTGHGNEVGGLIGSHDNDNISIAHSSFSGSLSVSGLGFYGVGGLVGNLTNTETTIHDSFSTSSIAVVSQSSYVNSIGGLVGYSEGTLDISSSYAIGAIVVTSQTDTANAVGGLIGYSDYDTTIADSFSQSDVTIDSVDTAQYIGGLLGLWDYSSLSLFQTYSSGNLTVTADTSADSIGGLVGGLDDSPSTITNSFTTGAVSVTAPASTNVGGLIGSYISDVDSSNTFYDQTLSTQPFCTGQDDPDPSWCTAKTDSTFFIGNHDAPLFSTWDFTDIWQTISGEYPILKNLLSPYPDSTPPSLSLNSVTNSSTAPTLTGTADDTEGTVSSVEFQLDATSSSWTVCTASDATFNESSELFTCILGTPAPGNHTVYVRTTDDSTNTTTDPDYASTTFTVSTSRAGGGGGMLNITQKTKEPLDEKIATTTATHASTTQRFTNTEIIDPTPAKDREGMIDPTTLIDLLITLGIIPADKADLARTLATQKSSENVGSSTPLSGTLRFTRTLSLGDTGDDVKILQQFLNTHGFTLAPTGTGSAGNETTYFGTKTKSAVMKFQDAYKADILIPAGLTTPTGMFGTYSIQKANAMLEG